MMEKNNFILRLKARQALAGHWQTALVVMLVASLPSWLAQIASLVQGGGLQQQLLTVLQYGNPELLADPQYLLRLVEGQLFRGLLKAVAAAAVALSAWWIGRRGKPGA